MIQFLHNDTFGSSCPKIPLDASHHLNEVIGGMNPETSGDPMGDYWRPYYMRTREKLLCLISQDPERVHLRGVRMDSPEEVERWFRHAFISAFVSPGDADDACHEHEDLKLVLFEVGSIRENARGDWHVNRAGMKLARTLALRSLSKTLDVLGMNTQRKYLERGPGDNRNVQWVREQCPDWECVSVGNVLYFSVSNLLRDFLRPELKQDENILMFLQILSVFLLREKQELGEGASIQVLFSLLADMGSWIHKYFGSKGEYVDSGEFECDTLCELDEGVKKHFRDLYWFFSVIHFDFRSPPTGPTEAGMDHVQFRKGIFLEVLGQYFQAGFCSEVARCLFADDPYFPDQESSIDLRRVLPVSLQGFTEADFLSIPELLEKESVGFSTDVRAASHELNDDFRRDLDGYIDCLAPGGVHCFDASNESYVKDDRSDAVLSLLLQKNAISPSGKEFRAFALVEKNASPRTRAQAIWFERAQNDGQFRSVETLSECIDTDFFDIVPLDEYANRFMIRYESQIRRIFKQVFYDRYQDWDRVRQQFSTDAVIQAIDFWAAFIQALNPHLLKIEDVFSIIGPQVEVSALSCFYQVPQKKRVRSETILEPDPTPRLRALSLRQVMR